ncbi:hypothetical protein [Nocardiopsis dassonvillei]|uniref:hypothetical protein n=1 Tax=Nocardiopsis dassonvillei TaxID=2014 RepID=UPI00363F6E68
MSLKDKLRGRARPTLSHRLRIASTEETTAAEAAVATARRMLTIWEAQASPDEERIEQARQALAEAEAVRDECYVTVTVQALKPEDFEALYDVYPPSDSKDPKEKKEAEEAYLRALFLECVQGDMTREDWEDVLTEDVSAGERNELYDLGAAVNGRSRIPNGQIPKG